MVLRSKFGFSAQNFGFQGKIWVTNIKNWFKIGKYGQHFGFLVKIYQKFGYRRSKFILKNWFSGQNLVFCPKCLFFGSKLFTSGLNLLKKIGFKVESLSFLLKMLDFLSKFWFPSPNFCIYGHFQSRSILKTGFKLEILVFWSKFINICLFKVNINFFKLVFWSKFWFSVKNLLKIG